MLVSLNWIKRYITLTENDPQKICDILTEKSAEVEDIIFQGKELSHVVLGQIKKITPHPDADKLNITQTEIGNGEMLQIVCGADNIYEGMKVPVAQIGAVLPGDFAIKKAKVRGIESCGMLSSGKELGLGEDHSGILDLSEKTEHLGTPIAEIFGQDDIIYEIENTSITNRADQFSHLGFAREFRACNLGKWKDSLSQTERSGDLGSRRSEISPLNPNGSQIKFGMTDTPLPIEINFTPQPTDILKSYSAISISGVDGKTESPEYIKKCLKSVGIEPKNALVDITNFVMFETGMPLHAFDLERTGKEWNFGLSNGGEKMVNLDGDEKVLPSDAIILTDEHNTIFDLCGIQGGKNSGIEDTTNNILLHAPVYDAVKIRRASIAVDHRTDASVIFEKNLPSPLAKVGLLRAIELVQEIFPEAQITSQLVDEDFSNYKHTQIEIGVDKITQKLGIEIDEKEIENILSSLEFEFSVQNSVFHIAVPYFRSDIIIPEDIIEEVARIYGLNTIPGIAPTITIENKPPLTIRETERQISDVLVNNGFYEVLTLAFYGKKLLSKIGMSEKSPEQIRVKNPLSEDLDIMRTSLTPRLLETAELNRKHTDAFRIFESGKIFSHSDGEKIEMHRITCLLVGDSFAEAKAIAEDIYSSFYITPRISTKKYELPFAHPARGAEMIAGRSSKMKVFEIHPRTAKEFNLPNNTSIVCMDLPNFESLLSGKPKIKSLPRFPGIDFDVSILAPEEITIEKLTKNLNKVDENISNVKVDSIWRGEGVEKGQKSITLNFEFRAADKTLTDNEAKGIEKKVMDELEKRGGVSRF